MIAIKAGSEGALSASGLGPEETGEGMELSEQLPVLDLEAGDVESKDSRRSAIHRLDGLLDRLESANLADRPHPSASVLRTLMAQGIPNPLAYTTLELIEIVFKTQGILMRANRSASAGDARDASEDDGWRESRVGLFVA